MDRVYFITDKTEKFDIKVVNEALVSKLSQDNSGFILFGSHLGGFDVLQYLKSKYGQASVVMDVAHNSMITDILYNLNPVMFDTIIDVNSDNTLLEIKESLDNAQFVAILADRKINQQKTIKCSLLGGDIQIPKYPFALPYILKKPAIVFFGVYMGKNKYEIHFKELKINHQDARTNREQNIAKDAQTYTSYMQEMIEKHPFNWFNFYDYWGGK
ncbi:Lysophospholipid acyltransferase [uncultured Candidatus Thioglobus sp.]|nr:Lysophospholipid acyltransferase [uncultured Candidatus Thioglobus sp.]